MRFVDNFTCAECGRKLPLWWGDLVDTGKPGNYDYVCNSCIAQIMEENEEDEGAE